MEFQIYTKEDKDKFRQFIDLMEAPFKALVDNIFKTRSSAQNRYMHKIIGVYAQHLGIAAYKLKEELQKKYLLVEELAVDDDIYYWVKSTAKLSTLELEKFCEDIRREAMMEHGLYLPLPNEVIDDHDELKLKLIQK